MTTFAKHVEKNISTSLILNEDQYTITSDLEETKIAVSLPTRVLKTIINLYFKLNPGEVDKFLKHFKREYRYHAKLSPNELRVFKYLQGKVEPVSIQTIGVMVGGMPPGKSASRWGYVLCRKLLKKGYLVKNKRGHYSNVKVSF